MPSVALTFLQDGNLWLKLASFAPHRVFHVPTYHFDMVHAANGEEMGRINLRSESTQDVVLYGGHIGYEVYSPYRGHHYAARAVKLLLPVAKALAIDPVWITCDPENMASRRACELAGADYIETVDLPPAYPGYAFGQRRKCRYRIGLS